MTPEETRQGIARFYDAVVRRDGETMAALYAPNARFEDAVFRLEGPDIMRMWKGLLGRARNFEASYRILEVGSGQGTAFTIARRRCTQAKNTKRAG